MFTGEKGTITPGNLPATSGQSQVVTPTVTTTYTLTVSNPAGSVVTQPVTVTVQDVSVQLTPSSRFVTVGKNVALAATVTGATDPSLVWSVVEPGGGTLAASGASATYTAPATPGTYHVRATSVEDPTKFGEFTATVVAAPFITSFTASSSPINRGASTTLTGVFTGGTGLVDQGVGSVSSGVGAAASPLVTTLYMLTVTNLAGDFVTKQVNVVVNGVTVAIAPDSITLNLGGSHLFTAAVTGAVDTSVTWTVTEAGGGTITPVGLYTTPAVDGTYHVVATSNSDPTVFDAAEVTVNPVAITIAPATFSSFLVGQTQQFTATVTGALDTSVTWAVTEPAGGTITPTGFYTAPLLLGTYHVTATANADPTKIATATIRVGTVRVVLTQPQPRRVTAGERFYFGDGITEDQIYRIEGATNSTGVFSSDEPGSSWGTEVILDRRPDDQPPAPIKGAKAIRPTGPTFYYQTGMIPGIYHFRIASQENPFAYAEYTFEVLQNPIITSFTLTQVGGSYSLNATFLNDTSPGATAVFTDFNEAYVGEARSGVPFAVGLTPKEAYRLTVTNSLYGIPPYFGGERATATASNIVVTINEGATWTMAGDSATTDPTKTFTATAAGSTAGVNWTVSGGTDPGSVGYSTGDYTPPSVPGTFTVTATSVSDPNKTDSIAVTVIPIFIWPGDQTVGLGHQLILRASVLGSPSTNVVWEMDPSTPTPQYGSVDPSTGVYTAWGTPPVPAVDPIVVAKLSTNNAVKASVAVNVSTAINGGGPLRGAFGTSFGPALYLRYHTLTALPGGNALLAGGEDGNGPASPTAYYYSGASNTFSPLNSFSGNFMTAVRKWGTATLLHDGRVLITGGENAVGTALASAEVFVPYSGGGTFQAVGSMTTARAFHTATLLPNGKVLLVGGKSGGGALASTELFDPLTNTFSPGPSLRSPRLYHSVARMLDGRVLIAGGSSNGGFSAAAASKQADLYTPSAGAGTMAAAADIFDSSDPTFSGLMGATMDIEPAGEVVLAGGQWASTGPVFQPSAKIFKYNPGSNTWTLVPLSLNSQRYAPMGMMLPDKTFAIWGGFSPPTSIEFFTPSTNTLEAPVGIPVSAPHFDGDYGRMVLLTTGRILVSGKDPGSIAFSAYRYPN